MPNRCVCCGSIIPEGRQVCPICEETSTTNCTSHYWSNICEMQKKQTLKGIKTYGQTLEQNKSLTIKETIEMAQEEMIDMLMYLEKLKEQINGN